MPKKFEYCLEYVALKLKDKGKNYTFAEDNLDVSTLKCLTREDVRKALPSCRWDVLDDLVEGSKRMGLLRTIVAEHNGKNKVLYILDDEKNWDKYLCPVRMAHIKKVTFKKARFNTDGMEVKKLIGID